jgi:hypothetical protein
MKFEYEYCDTQEEVRQHIKDCEGHHTQQAIYSTFHDGLTQICFGCRKIRSTIYARGGDETLQNTN